MHARSTSGFTLDTYIGVSVGHLSQQNPVIEGRLHQLEDVEAKLSVHLRNAQAAHKKVADKHCLDSSQLEPKCRLADHIWLLQRNVKTTRQCDKLDFQRLGPFVISSQVNDVAFRLDLPSHMRLHLVFQVSLMEPYTSSSIPNRSIPPPPPIQLLHGLKYEVEALLDSKVMRNKLYYLVDWLGYSPNEQIELCIGLDKSAYTLY